MTMPWRRSSTPAMHSLTGTLYKSTVTTSATSSPLLRHLDAAVTLCRLLPTIPNPHSKLNLTTNATSTSFRFPMNQEAYESATAFSRPEPEPEEVEKSTDPHGYRAVGFSYENNNNNESIDERNVNVGPEPELPLFQPSFPVPESLLHSLPPSEKVHQIIARTAMFVCKQGGQSEFILRVKQGDNPTFGFLMPDHHLHAYFRYLVDHKELLQTEDQTANNKENKSDDAQGALSLLGSVYGSGEDEENEDSAINENPENNKKVEIVNSVEKDASQKGNTWLIKKNPLVTSFRGRSVFNMKKDEVSSSLSADVAKIKESTSVGVSCRVVEPPCEIKKTIDKIVEFIAKNGKQFEATLVEQDSKHGRFPFLVSSNLYYPYYLQVLHKAQQPKVSGKKNESSSGVVSEKKSKENVSSSDIPYESERKEKFKMVISKTNKDQDANSKEETGVTVDVASAAAILQAASRGIKNPDLGINPTESHLTKEQKLKAERLKKAKMFVASLKGEQIRGSSVEPQASSVVLRSDRDRSSAPPAVDISDKILFNDEYNEKRSKRSYRSRSGKDDDEEEAIRKKHDRHSKRRKHRYDYSSEEEEVESDDKSKRKRSSHRSHKHKHKKRHCSRDKEEGEIGFKLAESSSKQDTAQSQPSEGEGVIDVSDDLRAKIRAMLMANR